MEELALHVLDIAQNSIAAGARRIRIRVRESRREDLVTIEVSDEGRGMEQAVRERATDPFFTTRQTRRVGLGLPLLEQAAQAAGGALGIESLPGAGTLVRAAFRYSHVDRQPLGDMAGTLLTLIVGHPEIEFEYVHQTDERELVFRTQEIQAELEGRPLSSPQAIAAVRKRLAGMPGKESQAHGTGNYREDHP